ncbi:RAI1 like PD-XK nuclease-domain-containing protein [Panaeolus papilionaceus]|nr:RAI1 like PD-XK nuclease-domain-containing protein [Panaeolus papilionaceus]
MQSGTKRSHLSTFGEEVADDAVPRTQRQLKKTERSVAESATTSTDTSILISSSDSQSQSQQLSSPLAQSQPQQQSQPRVHSLGYPNPRGNIKPRQIPFQQPNQLVSFSYTPEHVQEFTDSALRYFVDPPIGAKLGYGYDRWIETQESRGRIDSLLGAVSKVRKGGTLPEIGLVSWRGVMTKILIAPYENRDSWELNVMHVNGTLYLEEHASDERLAEKSNMTPRQRLQTYYGYAFESYCTSEEPTRRSEVQRLGGGVPPGWGGDVNNNVQWCSVVRAKLGDTRMIIGGEVDCVRGKYTGQPDTFVELKTSMAIRGERDESNFERKLLKFYFQSFLLGVPEIVVGFRTPAGVVTTVQTFKTIQLPRMVRGKANAWDPLVCLDWGYEFLTFLKGVVRDGSSEGDRTSNMRTVWRVKFTPGTGISAAVLDKAGVEEVVNGEERIGFLPRWYWDEITHSDDEEESRSSSGQRGEQVPVQRSLSNTMETKAGWQI